MIGHIVMFKLKEPKEGSAAAVRAALEPLGDGRVPGVVRLEIGDDLLGTPASWDLVLVATMADREALEGYLIHPDHVAAAGQLGAYVSDAGIVDFTSGAM
jgi:hypothetical protein